MICCGHPWYKLKGLFIPGTNSRVCSEMPSAKIGVNNFNQFNIIEMTGMKDMPNYIISLYKETIWKNRRASFSIKINDKIVMQSIDYNIRFYVNHIIGK